MNENFTGCYVAGMGKAHKCCRPHTEVFNCPMIGTFNIGIPHFRILEHTVTRHHNGKNYRFVVITNPKTRKEYVGWAIRDDSSSQRFNTLEILTKERIPEDCKKIGLQVRLPQLWTPAEIRAWASGQYWFQSFPFSPVKKADSQLVWDTIDGINWSQLRVLDHGCHYGYMSFKASEKGAIVHGVDKNQTSLRAARTIRDHIIQQDVVFTNKISVKDVDVVLYLSVHHQVDPEYKNLAGTLSSLRMMARKHIFVELIMPPLFPKGGSMTEAQIDRIVGGKILTRYKHRVRGDRKIYHIEV